MRILVEQLAEYRPTHLTAYASILHEIARQIESGRMSAQAGAGRSRQHQRATHAQAREHYAEIFGGTGARQLQHGRVPVSHERLPDRGGMHVNADWAILEVVDENNRPVPDGEKGAKVLVTNLANYVQPIIRYEIGDIITMATEPCDCGSNLPFIKSRRWTRLGRI